MSPKLERLFVTSDAVEKLWPEQLLTLFWDIVMTGNLQKHGLSRIMKELLHSPPVVSGDQVYLLRAKRQGSIGN